MTAPNDTESTKDSNAVSVESTALFADFREIVRKLDDLSYEMPDHAKVEELCGIIESLQQWGCRADKHDWIFDQCGYWQHQYCVNCGAAKYPELAGRRCGELDAEMGKITEEDFLSANVRSQATAKPLPVDPCSRCPAANRPNSLCFFASAPG